MASKIHPRRPLLLASGSPRRRELLERMGIPLVVRPVDVDESAQEHEGPEAYLERIAEAKATAAAGLVAEVSAGALLVADTVVILDGEILGKPRDDDDSAAMIRKLAGRSHTVATRYVLVGTGKEPVAETVRTKVWFRPLGNEQVRRYVGSGEGRDKAGAYGIQGIGACLVERIEGDYANVVGLPICAVVQAMERLGLLTACPMTTEDG